MNSNEILHSDRQQSLDGLFNPTCVLSYLPLRDRNIPASFFYPIWKATTAKKRDEFVDEPMREHPVESYHSRSVSYDHRKDNASGADLATSIHLQHDNTRQQPGTSCSINNDHIVDGQYQEQLLSNELSVTVLF